MSHAEQYIEASVPAALDGTVPAPVIVIGGGPVGMRAARELARMNHHVIVLSAEPYQPYNRVRLTPLLGGEVQFGEIALPELTEMNDTFVCHSGLWVSAINRDVNEVVTADGRIWPYSKLIIATGSDAFVPGIEGRDLPGVYTFRTAQDASALLARSISSRRVAVIGGGLLGLEAARGMRQRGCDVTVIEHENRLMPRQLDKDAGALLAGSIEALGVDVITGVAVREITGDYKVTGISLSDGREIDCDTVIICTGVRANTGLAREAKLAFSKGIIVNDRMQTSDSDIYAIGECTEHNGRLYGLVGPGYEQAETAVANIAGGFQKFFGSVPATKLKVIGAEVFSVGDIDWLETRPGLRSYVWQGEGQYRRIFVFRGKLAGAIAVGGWDQASRMQDAAQEGQPIFPWMLYRFRRNGSLWPDEERTIADQPDSAIVCNCTGVNCGQLRGAMKTGANSVEALGIETGAGTVCGTCQPVLDELLNASATPKPMRLWRPLLVVSGVVALAAMVPILYGNVPFPQSFDAESLRVWLWRDNIVKQWSGFVLLGITLAAMVIGLRKRIRFMDRLGSYDYWRLIHLIIGSLALAGFAVHTGFRLGANLNFWLATSFLATLVFGATAGLATGGDHELRARQIGTAKKPPRRLPTWAHIVAIWPLPVLVLAHVLASYSF